MDTDARKCRCCLDLCVETAKSLKQPTTEQGRRRRVLRFRGTPEPPPLLRGHGDSDHEPAHLLGGEFRPSLPPLPLHAAGF